VGKINKQARRLVKHIKRQVKLVKSSFSKERNKWKEKFVALQIGESVNLPYANQEEKSSLVASAHLCAKNIRIKIITRSQGGFLRVLRYE